VRLLFVSVLIGLTLATCGRSDLQEPETPDAGTAPSPGCADSTVAGTGARYRVCFPKSWNGDLVVYAHGYIPPDAPLRLADHQIGDRRISEIVTGLGYAFATTSYRANGLVVPEAVLDVVDLVGAIRDRVRPDPSRTFVIGLSEGGLVAALTAERYAGTVDGAVAACGPVGDFRRQINYIGDVRVVFDYFFPGVLPGTVIDVPAAVREEWTSRYVPAIAAALARDHGKARQLIRATELPVDGADPTTVLESVVAVLFYNVFGTEDARARLGGQPFDNLGRVYTGSDDDGALNRGVARHAADRAALDRIAQEFQTSGNLTVPVATLHTARDPDVPQFHQPLYATKVAAAGATSLLRRVTLARYGHCAFTSDELMAAFTSISGD
jgi:pimeloyl-ACP methyl ester carboxylesterase